MKENLDLLMEWMALQGEFIQEKGLHGEWCQWTLENHEAFVVASTLNPHPWVQLLQLIKNHSSNTKAKKE